MRHRTRLAILAALLAVPLLAPPASAAGICPYPGARRDAQIRANVADLCDELWVGDLTLAGNPALAASGIGFATTGIIFEGATADAIEGLLKASDVASSDKTWTLPLNSGTLALVGDDGVGDVVGPASATDLALCRFDSTTGKLLQDGVVVEGDAGGLSSVVTIAGNPALAASTCTFGTTGLVCEGATADAVETLVTFADPASADKTITFPDLTGSVGIVGTAASNAGDYAITGRYSSAVQSVTVADSGDGSAAAGTITPSSSYVEVTCSDTDGCTITMSETGAIAGSLVTVVNISANTATFADTAGVSETAGSFAAGINDVITYRYGSGVASWIEQGRSNN